ncbi:hypothetical protein TorRG33x02_255690 [Trema orientale]|uniref:Uncharacterized protein n=1 Tax=Trema orientale TaxID=63057 RepID=A0A2P5DC64_TREOI|nr:hypothetical protein TorRG33x02_255690 [Trema orientale]
MDGGELAAPSKHRRRKGGSAEQRLQEEWWQCDKGEEVGQREIDLFELLVRDSARERDRAKRGKTLTFAFEFDRDFYGSPIYCQLKTSELNAKLSSEIGHRLQHFGSISGASALSPTLRLRQPHLRHFDSVRLISSDPST